MKLATTAAALLAATSCIGCSTITQSETQSVALTATYQDKPVVADCRLTNDKGSWESKSPANVSVRKSGEDLNVTCKQEGMPDGLLTAISRAAGSMFGNIIFGGGIGALIDHNKGTGYDYPNKLPVKMGESTVVDKKIENQQLQAGQTVAASQNPAASQNNCSGNLCSAKTDGTDARKVAEQESPTYTQVQARY